MKTRLLTAALFLPTLLPLATGCSSGGKKVLLSRHPRWSYEHYTTVAVVPFKSRVPAVPDAGERMAAALENALVRNPDNTYRIMSRADLKAVMSEKDFAALSGLADGTAEIPRERIGAVQALIVGACTHYELGATKEVFTSVEREMVEDADGHEVIVETEHHRDRYTHSATVAAELRVIDTATGRILHSAATQPLTVRRERWDTPPTLSPEALAHEAVAIVAQRLLREIAVTRVTVRLRKRYLFTAREFRRDSWKKDKKFDVRDPVLYVVVRGLPAVADRNSFRLVVMNKDDEKPLVDEEFVWEAGRGPEGVSFEIVPAELVKHAGTGKYIATLYAGDEPVLEHEFRIRDEND